ncbi:MAG: TldD/PmbA family protein [Anaerolineae bacterium]|nr:TldD/PmbA family protein [Anaerolineae bacterium]
MLGEEKIREITAEVLSLSQADQTEVLVFSDDSQLTRFANSYIHQNVAERDVQVRVRAVVGKRIGVASTNDLSRESLEKVVETALEVARLQPENPDFISLPEPAPIPEVNAFSEATAGFTPEARARAVGGICRRAVENDLVASGAFSTSVQEIAVANSLGVFAYFPTTLTDLKTVIMGDDSSGYGASTAWDVEQMDAEAVGAEAVDKALRGRNPREIEPGRYTVILEEYATEDIVEMLSYVGLGALAVQEERSFMCDRFGQQIVGSAISLWDDGLDPRGLPLPFDFEGVPKGRVSLIENGVAVNVVYDSYTAGKEGKASTGHGLPAPNTFGPIPFNMFMAPGQASLEEMIASTERGVLVTRFWYTRPVHPKLAIITGMTRDGTFLIEKGEVAYPVKNLRFTQSYLDALSSVEMVGRTTKLVRSEFELNGNHVPALKLAEFEFTGVTEF